MASQPHLAAGVLTAVLAPSVAPVAALYYAGGAVRRSQDGPADPPGECGAFTACGEIYRGFMYGVGFYVATWIMQKYFPAA
jgi:hypothetical protein